MERDGGKERRGEWRSKKGRRMEREKERWEDRKCKIAKKERRGERGERWMEGGGQS